MTSRLGPWAMVPILFGLVALQVVVRHWARRRHPTPKRAPAEPSWWLGVTGFSFELVLALTLLWLGQLDPVAAVVGVQVFSSALVVACLAWHEACGPRQDASPDLALAQGLILGFAGSLITMEPAGGGLHVRLLLEIMGLMLFTCIVLVLAAWAQHLWSRRDEPSEDVPPAERLRSQLCFQAEAHAVEHPDRDDPYRPLTETTGPNGTPTR
ncbi:MAG: hypothetical protein AAF533_00985 [Acidobacteriota bacterium]